MEALRKLVDLKAQQTVVPVAERKAKVALRDLGIEEDTAVKSAATLKALHDLSQGNMAYDVGDFEFGARITPEEKRLRLGFKKDF